MLACSSVIPMTSLLGILLTASAVPEIGTRLAAQYARGDGLQVYRLQISSDQRFTYVLWTDVGTMESARGRVEAGQDGISFIPDPGSKLCDGSSIRKKWQAIPWGERLYLLEETEMLDFVNQVNRGSEPRSTPLGAFYLRDGDQKRPASGKPAVPARWRDYVLDRPASGRVVALLGDRLAEVDIGYRQGIRPGMVLLGQRGPDEWMMVTVTSVEKECCVITIEPDESSLFVGLSITSHW